MGKSVVIVGPDRHLGGLSSGGLGFTDTGNKAVIGGLSREFYHRIWQHYDQPGAGPGRSARSTATRGRERRRSTAPQRTMWIFEPHVAEQVFEDLVKEHQIPVDRNEWLDRAKGVAKTGGRITSITMLSGKRTRGRMFIDATYEGDLMAAAGVDYHVGRESQAAYGEKWNGVQTGVLHHRIISACSSSRSARTSCPAIRRAACCRASAPRLPASTARATRRCRRTATASA